MPETLLNTLNEKQKEAVTTVRGPVLILAGPGSGKTKTLTHRIAYLVTKGVRPYNVLAVTFTNKASSEMQNRVASLLASSGPEEAPKTLPLMGTFHSICVRILRENAPKIGYTSQFTIYDDDDQLSLLKNVMTNLDIDPKEVNPRKIRNIIARAKDNLQRPEELEAEADSHFAKKAAEVYEHYEKALRSQNGFDFGDLIMQAVNLFESNPEVLRKYQNRFKYILVDEYQDTNYAQNVWLNLLAEKSKNICAVGDDAQSIYSWRSADVGHILNFQQNWPEAKTIKLEQNYRSTQKIIQAASALIQNNTKGYTKNLWTENPSGDPIFAKELGNEYEEAEFILAEVERLTKENNYSLNDFVILYRTNTQSRAIEEVFIRYGLPYKIVGGVKFYQRQEIKDALAWLRLLQNENDTASKERLSRLKLQHLKENLNENPRTKEGAVDILLADFQEQKKSTGTLPEMMQYIVHKTNTEQALRDNTEKGEERWQNVQELIAVTRDYSKLSMEDALGKFLEDVTLMQEADTVAVESELVHLMTLHMAKGLEFPVVFMAGCEEGLLPHANSMETKRELEEERRLCYVGLTRAKEKAYILFTQQRNMWGKLQSNPPSSFLFEIPGEYMDMETLDPFENILTESNDEDDENDILKWE